MALGTKTWTFSWSSPDPIHTQAHRRCKDLLTEKEKQLKVTIRQHWVFLTLPSEGSKGLLQGKVASIRQK